MIRRRALLATPLLLAAPALRAQSLILRQDDFLAPGIRRGALIRWGDRVAFDAPAWTPAQPTVEAAAAQFGWDARIIALLPAVTAEDRVPRAVLVVVHPTVDAAMAFPDGRDRPDVAGEMQGVSLLNLARPVQDRGAFFGGTRPPGLACGARILQHGVERVRRRQPRGGDGVDAQPGVPGPRQRRGGGVPVGGHRRVRVRGVAERTEPARRDGGMVVGHLVRFRHETVEASHGVAEPADLPRE